MADPVSIATGVLTVGGFALKSSIALHGIIRGLQSQNRDARALKAEVSDLTGVLSSLLETIANNPSLDFQPLERPLQRCGNACEEYGKIISQCTKHSSNTSRSSMRDWITQKYLQGDINDFRAMLAAHKSTINIALANANLRIAVISPEVLENYRDMISDTTSDLSAHLEDLQEKIDRLKDGDPAAIDDVAKEWHAMLEEKESTQQGLDMCAQLSAQITRFESASTERVHFSGRPSAHKHIKTGLSEAGRSIQSLVARLQTHEALIDSQLEAMSLKEALSEPVAAQLARLQQTKESVSQCIRIVSDAGELAKERSNVFEDLTLADNSYAFSVSTVNDLVTARRLNLSGRSRHVGGQVTNETVQKSMEALTQLDAEYIRSLKETQPRRQASPISTSTSPKEPNNTKQFHDRFGPGVTLNHG
ncbi:hypothetical protein CH63R_09730 [Colletotrichum higginsianum IMI 349063]|uniref:Azaphilone pigments biosynthesis cluster protein L N-terminal domain-containing protein n=1 Tax=Colletotrichum higginsianum (strain IMI 349063) TaxID=759273 RepID=A0A1B7Y0R7_COLHI|nr:uncharacterized protein CH63R_09730 [Colletotrichum higginsianum IMI 349063]OBR05610.1 hypothetical protein CH63R_09730 [Colletotrichum higginsianum IMI 349063]